MLGVKVGCSCEGVFEFEVLVRDCVVAAKAPEDVVVAQGCVLEAPRAVVVLKRGGDLVKRGEVGVELVELLVAEQEALELNGKQVVELVETVCLLGYAEFERFMGGSSCSELEVEVVGTFGVVVVMGVADGNVDRAL